MDLQFIDNDVTPLFNSDFDPTLSSLHYLGPANGGSKIRRAFRRLSFAKFEEGIGDIGDLTFDGVTHINGILAELEECYDLLFTCMSPKTRAAFSHDYLERHHNPAIIQNSPDPKFSNFSCIGIQSHLLDPAFCFESRIHCRLGALHQNIEKAEVMLRNTDLAWVDLNVLRLSDNLGSSHSTTAGLTTEQFCTIARYIGASTHLKSVILTGYDENSDPYGMAAQNVALFFYYMVEGIEIRRKENIGSEEFQKYSVVHDGSSSELVFMEDQRSGRWWVQMYSIDAQKEVKIACTRQDYEEACNNRISDRLTSIFALV